ncbi:protein ydgH [Klebsiella pneumoniae]|nr:protein ydgH [Klebsiella pneumoniae]
MLQSPDAIPADSEAGRAALAKGGEAAKNVEIPGVATTAAVGSGTGVGRFFETQSSKGGRYTVTLPNGTKVEEVNKVTAAQMVPFDNIQFTGNYGNMTEISYQTAKRAAKKGRSTTTSPASGRNAAATSPSAPICTNNRCWLAKKAAHCRLFIFFHPPPLHGPPDTPVKSRALAQSSIFMRFRK